MKILPKELYFLFALFTILIVGVFLGQFFGIETYDEQCEFRKEHTEQCIYERAVYTDICGDLNTLIDDDELQECVYKCQN